MKPENQERIRQAYIQGTPMIGLLKEFRFATRKEVRVLVRGLQRGTVRKRGRPLLRESVREDCLDGMSLSAMVKKYKNSTMGELREMTEGLLPWTPKGQKDLPSPSEIAERSSEIRLAWTPEHSSRSWVGRHSTMLRNQDQHLPFTSNPTQHQSRKWIGDT